MTGNPPIKVFPLLIGVAFIGVAVYLTTIGSEEGAVGLFIAAYWALKESKIFDRWLIR